MDLAKTARFRVYAEVDRWPPLIRNRRIAENRKDNPSQTITFVVSGSSSLLLESESAESLAGRLDMLRLSPPDFRDYMTINGLEPPPEFKIDPDLRKIPTQTALYYGAHRGRLSRAYLDYLRWGGFPQLKELDDEESRRRYIKEVVVEKILRNDVFLRLREMDANLTFWRVGRQEIDFMFHVPAFML